MKSVQSTSCLVFGCMLALPASAQSLSEAIEYTIQTNPDILTTTKDRMAVEQEVKQARSGYFPTLDVTAGYGYEEANNPSTRARSAANPRQSATVGMERTELAVQLRQMVFDGFATSSEVRRQKNRVNSRAYTVFGTAEKVALDAAEAYLDVLREEELVRLAKDNLEIHEKTLDQIKLRSKMGVGRKADESQADGRVALAKKNLMSEEGNLTDAASHFNRVIGAMPKDLKMPQLGDKAMPRSLDDAINMAISNHPILKSAESDIEAAQAQRETAKSPFYPRVDIELSSANYSNLNGINGYNNDYQAMVRMRYNLFKGGKDYARLKETKHLIEESEEIRNKTHRQVEESMRFSWNAMETVQRQMDFFKEHAEATEKTHLAYRQQFSLGERTLLDLLDTANELYTAKTAYTNATYDHRFAEFRVLASMGGLNQALQVKLPEEATRVDSGKPLF